MLSQIDKTKIRFLLRNIYAEENARSWVRLIDTQSMSPVLSGNIFLLIEWSRSVHDLQVGDLVLFSMKPLDLLVVHRVCQLEIVEGNIKILQIADEIIAGGKVSGGWISSEMVFGRVVAIRWGETSTKIIEITSSLHHFWGKILAATSVIRWKHDQGASNNLPKLLIGTAINALHLTATYIDAALLRLSMLLT
jgi:hypothetical protein